jgi:hypothetical protein
VVLISQRSNPQQCALQILGFFDYHNERAMPYKVTIKQKSDHISMKVTGKWTPGNELDDSLDVWTQAADFCRKSREKGIIHVLSVWDVPGQLPTLAAFQLGDAASEISKGLRFKLAVVHLHKERFKDSLFAEKVAVNRGAFIKIFDNEREAKKWLLG